MGEGVCDLLGAFEVALLGLDGCSVASVRGLSFCPLLSNFLCFERLACSPGLLECLCVCRGGGFVSPMVEMGAVVEVCCVGGFVVVCDQLESRCLRFDLDDVNCVDLVLERVRWVLAGYSVVVC